MAATATIDGGSEAAADLGPAPRKRLSGKKLVLFILLPLVLVGATVGGLVLSGAVELPGALASAPATDGTPEPNPESLVFFDLPDLLVNLNSTGKRPHYLKIQVSLELADAGQVATLQTLAPRIIDNFQVYLRELRISDLQGSAGLVRLREELLRRVNAAVEPVKVRDVLFREMLVQ